MSLEEKVDALTSAIAGLTIAMQAQLVALGAVQVQSTSGLAETPAPKKEATKPATKAAAKKDDAPAAKAEIVVSFEDLKQAVVAAADKDKPATAAALKKLNVAKISELKEEQYEEALAALKAVVAGEAPESSQESSFV